MRAGTSRERVRGEEKPWRSKKDLARDSLKLCFGILQAQIAETTENYLSEQPGTRIFLQTVVEFGPAM